MPDYFGSLLHVEVSWAVFLLPLPTALALVVWWLPQMVSLPIRRALATAAGLVTLAFLVGFAAAMGNLGPGQRSLLGHALSFARLGSFDSGLTLLVDPLSLCFSAAIALTTWVTQSRLGAATGDLRTSDRTRPLVLLWALGALFTVLADDTGLALVGLGTSAVALTLLLRSSSTWNAHTHASGAEESFASDEDGDRSADLAQGASVVSAQRQWELSRGEPRSYPSSADATPPEKTLVRLVRPGAVFVVATAFAALFWLSGGRFAGPTAGFTPDGLARFGSVEAKPRKSAPPSSTLAPGDEAPLGFLTMTGSPGSWVALDGNDKIVRASPFVRLPVPAGLHRARIVGGAATDDVELGTFYVPPQSESYIAVVGPTASLREARNQFRVERADTSQGKLGLRIRLRDARFLGVPAGVFAVALLAFGALAVFGVFGAPLPLAAATPPQEPADAGQSIKQLVLSRPAVAALPLLVSRLALPAYLVGRAEFFSTSAPGFSAGLAMFVMGLAAAAGFRATKAGDPSSALSGAADALALVAVSAALSGSPGAAAVVAVGASAGLALAFGGAAAKTDNVLYLPGAALLALPPLGMAAPWAIGQAVASLASPEVEAPGLAMARAAALALAGAGTLALIAFAVFRIAAPDTAETAPTDAPKADEKAGAGGSKKRSKPKKEAVRSNTAVRTESEPPPTAETMRAGRQTRVLLAIGVIAIVLGALPLASLLGFTLPLFGWIDEGSRLRSPRPPAGLVAALLVAIAGLAGHLRAKTRAMVPVPTVLPLVATATADEGRTEPAADDAVGSLSVALQGLRAAVAPSLRATHAQDDAPEDRGDDEDRERQEADQEAGGELGANGDADDEPPSVPEKANRLDDVRRDSREGRDEDEGEKP
jgi:hypothetical protein